MNFENFFNSVRTEILVALGAAAKNNPLTLKASFPLGHKTVSEIGGRFIEEYATQALSGHFASNKDYEFEYLSSRSLGDFKISSGVDMSHVLYVDIKAQHLTIREETEKYYKENNIAQKKPGESHPNLISFEKAKDFFTDQDRALEDIAIFTIKYAPKIENGTVEFNVQEPSSDHLFLLRTLSESNLSFGALGKGQIQLSRLNNLVFENRSKAEFLDLVRKIASKPRSTRAPSVAK
jgi:hypothetical protein